MSWARRFFADKSANFAVLAALAIVPLAVAIGGAIDMGRVYKARTHLQFAVDAAALAIAREKTVDPAEIRRTGSRMIAGQMNDNCIEDVEVMKTSISDMTVTVAAQGKVEMTMLKLLRIDEIDVAALADVVRSGERLVEIALVLDNTWSMSEKDKKGVSRIAALKSAATRLVDQLVTEKNGFISVGVVPYADYVNVGVANRNKSWLDVAEDYADDAKPKVCTIETTKTVCLDETPKYTCTKVIDGVSEVSTCGGKCLKEETRTVKPYESCTGGGSPKYYEWFGCVGSRQAGTDRLNDGNPFGRYPGYLTRTQKCLTPILPLSKEKADILKAIDDMIINIGSYKPNTYLPAGLIWGQNILSPSEPMSQGAPYDARNENPRKIMILMTDGENTLKFKSSNGTHEEFSSTAGTAKKEYDTSNAETQAVCEYSKSKKIEIFTVAFMVESAAARALLSRCASSSANYYDASDADALLASFSEIASSISAIRLAR